VNLAAIYTLHWGPYSGLSSENGKFSACRWGCI